MDLITSFSINVSETITFFLSIFNRQFTQVLMNIIIIYIDDYLQSWSEDA